MSIHNEAKEGEIAKIVLMPGDPLRAKYIAENFLDDYKLVNKIRNIFAYTGRYKGKEITVMASGMGMPSMGIYCYELYKFYNVETIIRIGSSGGYHESLNLLDIVLVDESYTLGNFALQFNDEKCNCVSADRSINEVIRKTAEEQKLNLVEGNVACTDVFDAYMTDPMKYLEKLPKEKNILCPEMESFALLYTAKVLGKKAGCILTVVDSMHRSDVLTPEQRERSLNDMIKLGLESVIKL